MMMTREIAPVTPRQERTTSYVCTVKTVEELAKMRQEMKRINVKRRANNQRPWRYNVMPRGPGNRSSNTRRMAGATHYDVYLHDRISNDRRTRSELERAIAQTEKILNGTNPLALEYYYRHLRNMQSDLRLGLYYND